MTELMKGAEASLGASPKLRWCNARIVVAGASLQATLGSSRSSDDPSVSEAMLRPRRSQRRCRGRCVASATLGSSQSSNAPAATIPASLKRCSGRDDPNVAVEAGASLQRRWDRCGRSVASATLGSSRSSDAPAATIPASLSRPERCWIVTSATLGTSPVGVAEATATATLGSSLK
nr:hypothetical protein CFP56_50730 [Quercus suber]